MAAQSDPGLRRLRAKILASFPSGPAGWVLLGLIIVGLALRALAAVAWWPATTTLSDSWPYAAYAGSNPLDNPQHPGGYSALLATLGVVSKEVAVPIVIQHLLSIFSALLLFAAVRRVTSSAWPALVPVAAVLLNADQIYLEHSIMSEAPFVFVLSLSLYWCVRAFDEFDPWWRWPLLVGVGLALATTIRSAGLFLIPVAILSLLLAHPRPWRPRWPAVAATVGVAAAILVAFAVGNAASTGRFEIGPSQGWHLYQRVAPFADCSKFTPPEGTEGLCEQVPESERPGGDFYLFDPRSPAVQEFGSIGNEDGKVGAWASRAALAQPVAFARAVWVDMLTFFVPSRRDEIPYAGGHLDPQLDWSAAVTGEFPRLERVQRDTEAGMETFYNDFAVAQDATLLSRLHDYQRLFRFGAAPLTIATVLSLIGLAVGPRRHRIGVLLFGVGGLALLLAPVLGGLYVGRYSVPLAGLMAAAAAIAVTSLWRMEVDRRRTVRAAIAAD